MCVLLFIIMLVIYIYIYIYIYKSVFDTSNICSAVFTLAINRLHSFKRQPFWFHSLNSMVPVKGIDLFY